MKNRDEKRPAVLRLAHLNPSFRPPEKERTAEERGIPIGFEKPVGFEKMNEVIARRVLTSRGLNKRNAREHHRQKG